MLKKYRKVSFKGLMLPCSILLVFVACKQVRKVTDLVANPTPRELYARDFETDTVLFPEWKFAFEQAFNDSLIVELPYVEHGTYFDSTAFAYSYNLSLEKGTVFHAETQTDSLSKVIFFDLYRKTSDSLDTYDLVTRNTRHQRKLSKPIESSGTYKLILQPGIKGRTAYRFKAYSTPSYSFPVAGKDNSAIQSFWGASRASGRRSHKGVDIFADRGTPVVAVTKGRISSVGERGLGGKQVWLRAGLLGNSLYYAHLDSIAVKRGKHVEVGDTLVSLETPETHVPPAHTCTLEFMKDTLEL